MPYLVRHAHAGVKHAWTGPDSLRPLSGPGRREAHGLLTQLRDYQITRILSSFAAVAGLVVLVGLVVWLLTSILN